MKSQSMIDGAYLCKVSCHEGLLGANVPDDRKQEELILVTQLSHCHR